MNDQFLNSKHKQLSRLLSHFLSCDMRFKLILKRYISLCFHSKGRTYSVHNVLSAETLEKEKNCNLLAAKLPESPYYFENGLRKVYPFYYHHQTYCKGRWINKKLIDVYCEEFALYPREEYEKRISNGIVTVNSKVVDMNYVLKNGDFISAVVHKHELPVLACPIEIVYEDDNFFVVNKPPSIPVHPCGLYRNNTIVHILANDYNIHNLYVIHRLDRLVSGVLIFTKSSEKSKEIHTEMDLRSINKEYVCRVNGNFPDGSVICNKPLKQFYHKVGVTLVHPHGKTAVTEFKKLSFNGKTSVVICKPYTGRTHQIRAHLQFLGYPIVNDPLYNSTVFGPQKGKNGVIDKSINQLLKDLFLEHSCEWGLELDNPKQLLLFEENMLNASIFKRHYNMNETELKLKKNNSQVIYDENCYFCNIPNQDPQQNRFGIFLHAYKYQGEKWEFKSDMPFWASEDWNPST